MQDFCKCENQFEAGSFRFTVCNKIAMLPNIFPVEIAYREENPEMSLGRRLNSLQEIKEQSIERFLSERKKAKSWFSGRTLSYQLFFFVEIIYRYQETGKGLGRRKAICKSENPFWAIMLY